MENECNIKVDHIHTIEWDGTVETFNKIVDICLFNRDEVQICFLDDNYDITNKFTDKFRVIPIKFNIPESIHHGITYTKGDYIQYNCKENK